MNFSYTSFKYFSNRKFTSGNWGKNSIKMLNTKSNLLSKYFAANYSNKIHYVNRIQLLNNCLGADALLTGNGFNLYSNPDIASDILSSNSLISDSLLGCGSNIASNFLNLSILNKHYMRTDGK
jgi:hypothetical protein